MSGNSLYLVSLDIPKRDELLNYYEYYEMTAFDVLEWYLFDDQKSTKFLTYTTYSVQRNEASVFKANSVVPSENNSNCVNFLN